VELGRRAGVGRIVLAHHKPDRTDAELDLLAARFASGQAGVTVGAEGGILEV
jgi:phosphoribosyl 1,2-cyclic phosphodiesterase